MAAPRTQHAMAMQRRLAGQPQHRAVAVRVDHNSQALSVMPRGPAPRVMPRKNARTSGRHSRVSLRADVRNSMELLTDERCGDGASLPGWDAGLGEAPASSPPPPATGSPNVAQLQDSTASFLASPPDAVAEEDDELKHSLLTLASEVDAEASRRKFEEWLDGFNDQERRFISPVVLCEVQYNEIIELTRGWQEPNMLRTAACSVLFDKLVPCYALTRDSLLERLKNDLLYAIYSEYSPQVAASFRYLEHAPWFVQAQDFAKRQRAFDQRYQQMVERETIAASSAKFVKSVDARKVEQYQAVFYQVTFALWRDFVRSRQKLVSRLKYQIEGGSPPMPRVESMGPDGRKARGRRLLRCVRQVMQDWKLTTAESQTSKLGQRVLYLEEQLELLAQSHPDAVAEARSKANARFNIDDVALEDLMRSGDQKDGAMMVKPVAPRPMTWTERLQVMYYDALAEKPPSMAQTLDAIADIYAAKVQHDAAQDATRAPRQNLPEFCRDHMLSSAGIGSNASKRLCEIVAGVRKYRDLNPRIRTFCYLMNADCDAENWDPQAVNFFLSALTSVVPDWLVLSRLFQESTKPTVSLEDALRASEEAFNSPWSFAPAPLTLIEQVRALANCQGLIESDLSRETHNVQLTTASYSRSRTVSKTEKTMVLGLDSWLDLVLKTWIGQLQQCKKKTMDRIEREQRQCPGGVLAYPQFQNLMRNLKEGIADSHILFIYNQTMDFSGRTQDKFEPRHLFEVCRDQGISYIGDP